MSTAQSRVRRSLPLLAAPHRRHLHVVDRAVAPACWGKAAFDRMAAAGLLLALSPLMVVIAVLVKATSRGPVLFASPRAGVGERPFGMLKFRSMRVGAHLLEDELESTSPGPFFKVREDARVTPLGAFLRVSSLDELPQLLNVVRGDMSLVGPRPLMPREVRELHESVRAWRFSVLPGITGLWQVGGRSNTTPATRLRFDRLYVERRSLALDLRILARTPAAVVRADGAV